MNLKNRPQRTSSNTDQLGPLELGILKVLWESGGWLDVKDVAARLDGERAYTTVMTTLARLHKKRLVEQKKIGRAFVYRPKVTQQSVVRASLSRLANALFNGDLTLIMPQLLNLDDNLTPPQLERLRQMADHIKDIDKP